MALALGGRTIAELQATMSQAEFRSWLAFYRLFPFDDRHRYHRPAAAIASTQGRDVKEVLDWLEPDASLSGYSEAELRSFKAHGFKPPPRFK